MSEPLTSAAPDALAREWVRVAGRARARYVRRVLVTSALALVILLGIVEFGAVLLWAVRTTTWWALAPAGVHALGILLAIGWPARSGTSLLAPVPGFKAYVARRVGDRVERLRALCTVVLAESGLLFVWPLARLVAFGEQPRWGVAFTTAICSLAILWPLQRIADAQRAESRRLIGVADGDTR
jgi:hypothetical protein